jgi:hypothetical protein
MSARRPWKERRVNLARAMVLTLDGPGDEWLMLCRGVRSSTKPPKATRSPQPRTRRRLRVTGNA